MSYGIKTKPGELHIQPVVALFVLSELVNNKGLFVS